MKWSDTSYGEKTAHAYFPRFLKTKKSNER
jgi:hypothetical protein